jgi:predicted dehydrogenase
MKKIKFGIIGYGFMGRTHAWGCRSLPFFYRDLPYTVELAAVASPSESSRRLAMQEGGFAFETPDWRELIARPDIDAVAICTPNNMHREMLLEAIAAGKHIYCDKPLTVDYAQAQDVTNALVNSALVHQTVFNYRFYASSLRAKELMEEGRIGTITSFRGIYLHSGSIYADKPMGWKQQSELEGGGVLLDLGCHVIDLLRWLMGDIDSIWGASRVLFSERPVQGGGLAKVTAEDQCVLTMKLANGAIGSVEASKIATGVDDLLKVEIHGTKGALILDLSDSDHVLFFDESDPEAAYGGERGFKKIRSSQRYPAPASFPPFKNASGWTRSHAHCLYSFMNSVHEGKPASPSLIDGAEVQKILDAARRSFSSEKWEKI